MADPFGIGAGIVGIISVTIQITQVVVQFGLDWKNAPHDVKNFMAELQSLKTILSETNTNILLNPDFAEAFQGRNSLLLSQLGTDASSATDTRLMLATCQKGLENLLSELKKRAKGHRVGWERFKGAFLAQDTRESIENLHRQCQTLNSMVSIDATILGLTTYKELKEARKEQQEWHQAEAKASSAIKDGVDQLNQGQENQERQQERRVILDWLTPMDYATQQSDFIGRRQEGTGQWLLDSKEFKEWLGQSKQTLFCPGMPGAGKTIITSIVVHHLHTTFRNDPTVGIAYLYCNFRRQHEQKPTDLLLSLLKQLVQEQPSIPESVKELYTQHKDKRTRPLPDQISKALHSVVADYSRAFIIVDALDECQVSDGGQREFLAEIFNLQTETAANIFATSRFIPEIKKEFEGCVSVEIYASRDDVQRYLEGHMSQLPSFVSRNVDLQEEIMSAIVNAVDGMFLLAQLHLASLIGKRSPKAIRTALKQLPTGFEGYDSAYNEAMQRIEGQIADSRELAKQVLSWITCAKRPLTTSELRHAIAVEVGASKLDEENLPEIEDIVSVCAGLVTVDQESDIIRLVHYTTQQYFRRTQSSWFPNAQTDIAKICVTYLLFDAFEAGFCSTSEGFESRLQLNPLYDYAARNWGYHARAASAEVEQLILDLLESEAKVSSSSQAMMASRTSFPQSDYSQRVPTQVTGVHLAAYFGLREVMIVLLKNGHDSNSTDTYGRTSLWWAARNGHGAVVKLLLAKDGVDPNSKDTRYGRTPLWWAAENGHEAVVKLLLAKDGIDSNSKDEGGRTPLLCAAENGHEAVVRQLLAKDGIDPDSKDTIFGATPLSLAAMNGHGAVVKLLLANDGVDLNSKDTIFGATPLWWAARSGHGEVVKLLLAKDGVDPDCTGSPTTQGVPLPIWTADLTVLIEQRQHPRRSSTTLSGQQPPTVDSIVDSATQLVEVIDPLDVPLCRNEAGIGRRVLPVRTFIKELLRRSKTSYSITVVALYYLILIKPHIPHMQPLRALGNGRVLFLTALILASKNLQDRNYSTRAWSKISGLKVYEINTAEEAFLEAIDYKLHITAPIFERWQDILLGYILARHSSSLTPVDPDVSSVSSIPLQLFDGGG